MFINIRLFSGPNFYERETMNMDIYVSLSGEKEFFVYMPISGIDGAYGTFMYSLLTHFCSTIRYHAGCQVEKSSIPYPLVKTMNCNNEQHEKLCS